jgi:hypothetical protein
VLIIYFQFILCFLTLVLDRHYKIMNTANTLVLSEREFQTMTFSLRNLVSAFTTRYQTLTQSWKQQRLDSDFLVQCFAGGIFDEWHGYFEDVSKLYSLPFNIYQKSVSDCGPKQFKCRRPTRLVGFIGHGPKISTRGYSPLSASAATCRSSKFYPVSEELRAQ